MNNIDTHKSLSNYSSNQIVQSIDTIFLVCTSKTFKNHINEILEYSSYELITSEDEYSSLIKILEINPSLILLDFETANKDDYKLFKALKGNKSTSSIPIIFIIEKENLIHIPLEIQWQSSDFIIKPLNSNELEFTFNIHLDKENDTFNESTPIDLISTLNLIQIPIFIIRGDKLVYNNISYKKSFFSTKKNFLDIFPTQHHITIRKNVRDLINLNESIINNIEIEVFNSELVPKQQLLTLAKCPNEENKIIGYFFDNNHHFDESTSLMNRGGVQYCNSPYNSIKFSKREKEVLQLASKGYNSKEIASSLFISDRTVEKHRASLMNKLGAKNFIQVIVYSIKYQLIDV